MGVLMAVVGPNDEPHLCAPEIETNERAEQGRAMESEAIAMAGSVNERVGGGGGSCSGDRAHTGGGNWGCTRSLKVSTNSPGLSSPV